MIPCVPRARITVAAFVLAVACGGPPTGPSTPRATGVEAAALPYVVYDRDGRRVDDAALFGALAAARAVCVGEQHSNPHHHWVQLRVVDELSRRAAAAGRPFALGMEMFQRPFQAVLDAYARGRIDDRVLLARTEWRKRWGYDFALYRPIVALAIRRGAALVALNVRKEIASKVGRHGLDGLTDAERAELPELDLSDARHRAWFDGVMREHPGGEVTDSVYAAQVLWDETMADTAARWLSADSRRRMVILAGNGHCHDSAVVARLRRRGIEPAVSVRPVIDDGEGGADDALRDRATDFVVVMTAPSAGG
ncbi:MAG: hypothetical protein D6689_05825 [Deltaproteobacteria bacterium]|nr:MAG: hypothetical protein D6689_05825 [Deltaproteobacteria bacterium]